MMETVPILGHGGRRSTTVVTSSADAEFNLSAYMGRYVLLIVDKPVFAAQVPTGGGAFAIDPTINQDVGANPVAGAGTKVMFRRVPADTYVPVFVVKATSILLLRAQSVSTSYVEFVVASLSQG